jgi:hypothetical protein
MLLSPAFGDYQKKYTPITTTLSELVPFKGPTQTPGGNALPLPTHPFFYQIPEPWVVGMGMRSPESQKEAITG